MAVYEVTPFVIGEYLAVFLSLYGQILDATSDKVNGKWSFDIILVRLAFVSVHNCLDICGQKMRTDKTRDR